MEEVPNGDWPRLLLILPIILSCLLAASPMLLFGDGEEGGFISREDLSKDQLETLEKSEIARSPVDVREGMMALSQAILLDSGSLIVAGTWEGKLELANWSIQSYGGRDIFVAELTFEGIWASVHSAGSSGEDSIALLSISGDLLSLWGRVNGDARFGSEVLDHDHGWSPTAFEAHFYIEGGWNGVWQIDEDLLPRTSTGLWCGFT